MSKEVIHKWRHMYYYSLKCHSLIKDDTVKLGYNEHGYNEFTAITNKIY